MPRSIQAFPRNAVMNHNPMQNMVFDPTAIAKIHPSRDASPRYVGINAVEELLLW